MFKFLVIKSFKLIRFIYRRISVSTSTLFTKYLFIANNVNYGKGLTSNGIPIIDINTGCELNIGNDFRINNGTDFNRIGRQQPCYFVANYGGNITIGNNVGMSGTAIICHKHINIGNNVRIGGNTVIYDTDFHNLEVSKRITLREDTSTVIKKSVQIEDNVFIGAHTTVLKGVSIGKNSIIGAGSVVSKNVPANQIWAGNPAKFIKSIEL